MRVRAVAVLWVASALLSATRPGWCGAWTLPTGTGQAIVSGLYFEADEAFAASGESLPVPEFRKGEVSAYVEYGLSDRWTLVGQTEFTAAASGEPLSIDTARFGVSALGARYRLWDGGGAVLSIEATGRIAPADPDRASRLPVEAQGDVRLLAGTGFEVAGFASFAEAQGAYRFGVPLEDARGAAADEVRLDLTLGTRPRPDWLLLVQSFNRVETGAGDGEGAARRSHKIALGVVYDVSATLSLQVGAVATVAGADALAERGLVSAVWVRF